MRNDWSKALKDGQPWPMVHVFVPAIVSIYVQNIWVLISVIYIFESVEFLVSEIVTFWAESSVDTLVSDVLMGVLGFWIVHTLNAFDQKKPTPWYAILKPTAPGWYATVAPYIHVLLSAGSSSFPGLAGLVGIDLPIYLHFGLFGLFYVMWALLFGHEFWGLFSFFAILIITAFSVFTRHTVVVTSVVSIAIIAWEYHGLEEREKKKKHQKLNFEI